MFEEGLVFLVSIVDPTAYMLVDHINSKSAESIWPKLQRQIRFYEKFGHKVKIVMSDPERGVDVLKA